MSETLTIERLTAERDALREALEETVQWLHHMHHKRPETFMACYVQPCVSNRAALARETEGG